jgi:hypothetical protein
MGRSKVKCKKANPPVLIIARLAGQIRRVAVRRFAPGPVPWLINSYAVTLQLTGWSRGFGRSGPPPGGTPTGHARFDRSLDSIDGKSEAEQRRRQPDRSRKPFGERNSLCFYPHGIHFGVEPIAERD